jgi:hypothetical protein
VVTSLVNLRGSYHQSSGFMRLRIVGDIKGFAAALGALKAGNR